MELGGQGVPSLADIPLIPAAGAQVLVQPSAEVREGTAVTLTCLGAGDTAGDTLYDWYRNGKRLPGGSAPTLRFPSIRGEDAGAFQCQARGGNDSDVSVAVALRVLCECWGVSGGGAGFGVLLGAPCCSQPWFPLKTAKALVSRAVEEADISLWRVNQESGEEEFRESPNSREPKTFITSHYIKFSFSE